MNKIVLILLGVLFVLLFGGIVLEALYYATLIVLVLIFASIGIGVARRIGLI